MKSPIHHAVTCRALIVDDGQLLMAKHDPKFHYFALPGGRLEIGEHLTECIARELIEELGIRPEVGKILIINDWVDAHNHLVEFFFWIRNARDYRTANTATSTHGHELAEVVFGDATDPKFHLMPAYLREKFPRIVELGEDYPTELIATNT